MLDYLKSVFTLQCVQLCNKREKNLRDKALSCLNKKAMLCRHLGQYGRKSLVV